MAPPRFFKSPAAFRAWLEKRHDTTRELWVGFYRKASGRTGIAYLEAVDEALCFGWIDGIKKRLDEERYMHRFTPRKSDSTWSVVNTKRAKALIKLGRMAPAGHDVFRQRDRSRTALYSYERAHPVFNAAIEAAFRANAPAWTFFHAQPPGYQKLLTFWVMSARRDETRRRRLARLVTLSAAGKRVR
jgi:uncharacterized protein YdeI (YjbR/CyaY-like superfamily)